ncbi:MAG: hypothetical protein ACLFP2_01435 [Candidatus Woesearchaeota archaeon]
MKEDVIVSILKAEKNAHRAISSARTKYEKKLAHDKEKIRSEYKKRLEVKKARLDEELKDYSKSLKSQPKSPPEYTDEDVSSSAQWVLEVLLSGY